MLPALVTLKTFHWWLSEPSKSHRGRESLSQKVKCVNSGFTKFHGKEEMHCVGQGWIVESWYCETKRKPAQKSAENNSFGVDVFIWKPVLILNFQMNP